MVTLADFARLDQKLETFRGLDHRAHGAVDDVAARAPDTTLMLGEFFEFGEGVGAGRDDDGRDFLMPMRNTKTRKNSPSIRVVSGARAATSSTAPCAR